VRAAGRDPGRGVWRERRPEDRLGRIRVTLVPAPIVPVVPSRPSLPLVLLPLLAACTAPAVSPPASAPVAAAAPDQPVAPGAMAAADPHAAHGAVAAADPHAAHAGHDMAAMPPVTIPAGALITEADVRFMQHMIAHHAQAVYMTRLADSAGAGARVLTLARKIDLSQAGEIALMQDWLRAYGQFVPDTASWRGMRMVGMLTGEQLADLQRAKGTAFDRLFLRLMIQHHEGAIQMVADLLKSPRAAQEVDISVLANEIEAAQMAEIGLMWQMLADVP
jgi:uncharacterized protein (DUF305 family)